MSTPDQSHENSEYPLQGIHGMDRRRFLETTLAAISSGISGCLGNHDAPKKGKTPENQAITTWTEERRADIFARERQHEFFKLATPERMRQWLEANAGPMFCPEDSELKFDILCPDDRILLKPDERAWRIGGAGILLAYDEQRKQLNYQRATALLQPHRKHIRGIKNHRCGCGACKIVATSINGDGKEGDRLGAIFAHDLADLLGVPYLGEAVMEQEFADGHPGSIIFFDPTRRLQNPKNAHFPHGFVIHHWGDGYSTYAKHELWLAAKNIILDPENGIGTGPPFINCHRPGLILASGRDAHHTQLAAAEASSVATELNAMQHDEVFKVIPFTAPHS